MQSLVHAEHVPNFATTNTDITGWNVAILTDVSPQFHHEGLAKPHHFAVGLALGVKIRTALATAHGQARQGILENLLKRQKLQDRSVNARVKSKTAFVGSNGAIKLDAEATVHLSYAFVVNPWDSEVNQTLWLNHPFNDGDVLWIFFQYRFQRFQHFFHRLVEFRLFRVTGYDFGVNCITGAHRHTFLHRSVYCPVLTRTLSNGCPITPSQSTDFGGLIGGQNVHTVRYLSSRSTRRWPSSSTSLMARMDSSMRACSSACKPMMWRR